MFQLKEHHFDGQYLKLFKNDVVLICYKAEWCGFCQRFKPTYQEISKLLLNKVVVAEVDADECRDMISKNNKFLFGYKINHFPSIVIYKNGYFVEEYDDIRNTENIINAVKKYL